MPRVIALLLSLAFTLPVHAEGFITRLLNKPVPGGVAVMSLGNGATPPHVRYQDKPALVIREDDQRWTNEGRKTEESIDWNAMRKPKVQEIEEQIPGEWPGDDEEYFEE